MKRFGKIICCLSLILITLLNYTRTEKSELGENNTLTQYHTEYVGDSTKVIQITSKQSYPPGYSYDHIAIESKEEPYGLTVYLTVEGADEDSKKKLKENANVTFELIGNLESIKYIDVATADEIASFTRESWVKKSYYQAKLLDSLFFYVYDKKRVLNCPSQIEEEQKLDLEKFVEIELLFSLYQQLLTEKQRQVMEYYYQEDYSLSEISDLLGISRQAVHDNIKRTEIQLFEYESKLRLSDKLSKTEELERNINQLEEFLKHDTVSLRTKKLVAMIKSQCKELLE